MLISVFYLTKHNVVIRILQINFLKKTKKMNDKDGKTLKWQYNVWNEKFIAPIDQKNNHRLQYQRYLAYRLIEDLLLSCRP